MILTPQALSQHLQIAAQLKRANTQRVRELQELETKTQNELMMARQLDSFLDIFAEMLQNPPV